MSDRVGQQIGNYKLLQLLGRGGFADIYLGKHVYLKTTAAVKVLQKRLSRQKDLDNFLKEAQTIAHLQHPHIVRVLDFGVDHETPYLIMDYAHNGTLHGRHPHGTRVPLSIVVTYVKQIAAALQYAHNQGLIHRDIKPENMLINQHNDIWLSDFGIALTTKSAYRQPTPEVIGTVAYMAPEQIQGQPDPASDQYALGVVVYEWLSGMRPFRGSFMEVCQQHMSALPLPLREKVPDLPGEIEQVIAIALAKEPKKRFASIQAFANALEQASKTKAPKQVVHGSVLPAGAMPIQSVYPVARRSGLSGKLASLQIPYLHLSRMGIPLIISPVPQAVYPISEIQPDRANAACIQFPLQPLPTQRRGERINIWQFGKWQVIAYSAGLLLYVLLAIAIKPSFIAHNNAATILALAIGGAIIPFLAAIAGPLVGLFTGSIGSFVFFLIVEYTLGSNYLSVRDYSYWGWLASVFLALFGYVIGFSFLKTQGRFTGFRSIAYVGGITMVTLMILNLIVGYPPLAPYLPMLSENLYGPSFIISSLISLCVLLIALAIYGRFQKRSTK